MIHSASPRPLLYLVFSIGFLCCKKERINLQAFWDCHNALHLDSAAISSRIQGTWSWQSQHCYWGPSFQLPGKSTKVTFYSNHKYSVQDESHIVTEGDWQLELVDNPLYGLQLSPPVDFLYGRILFCDDQLLLNDSYIDGCDNLFKRVK